jgi:LysR family nitrogen assimilation transcriptional regulator
MDLKQIRAFVTVFERGSINSAAANLRVAQPSLSLQIKNLEESVGVKLFERHARGVHPTAAGERFYGDVGLIPTVTKGVLAEVLPAYMEALPNMDVRVVEAYSGNLTSWVMSGELDFALVTEPPRHDGLEMRVLSSEPLAIISGRKSGLTHLEPVRLQQMPPVKLVLPSSQHSLRAIIERYIKLGDIKVERIIEIDGLFGSLEFIRHSDFSAILPVTTIVRDLDQDDVVVNPLEDMQTTFEYFLVHQTQRPLSAAARKLVARLEEALRHTARAWDDVLMKTALAAK